MKKIKKKMVLFVTSIDLVVTLSCFYVYFITNNNEQNNMFNTTDINHFLNNFQDEFITKYSWYTSCIDVVFLTLLRCLPNIMFVAKEEYIIALVVALFINAILIVKVIMFADWIISKSATIMIEAKVGCAPLWL